MTLQGRTETTDARAKLVSLPQEYASNAPSRGATHGKKAFILLEAVIVPMP